MTRRIVYPDAGGDVDRRLSGERLTRLQLSGDVETFVGKPDDDATWLERIGDAEGILLGWGIPPAVLEAAPRLEVIAFTGIGAGNFVDLAIAKARGITVCNTPGYADNTVAEHAVALMLAGVKQVARLDAALRAGRWEQSMTAMELRGKRVGLVGFGGIARRTAEICSVLGMDVVAWTRNPDPERARRHGASFVDLDTLLATSDVVSVHIALADETRGLLDAGALSRLASHAWLVNTARGEIVDESALVDALQRDAFAGAALDVFADEPLPPGHPLLALDNVVLTPHVAYNTPEATEAIYEISVGNLIAYFEGEPRNVVTT